MPRPPRLDRRTFLSGAGASLLAPSILSARQPAATPSARPVVTHGVASGDVTSTSAVLWSRCDRPARMLVEYATTESFRDVRRVPFVDALEATDFTAKIELGGLPAGERIVYRVRFRSLEDGKAPPSEPVVGSFRTAPMDLRDIHFAWSGDTAGQGYGINPDWGGMRIYESMRKVQPQFFLHSGDTIYADNPLTEEVKLDDGSIWKNLVTPAKRKVAETLDEYRGNFAYNLLDENVRRFNAEVPLLVQWDDHETLNNWYPGEILDDPRYKVRSCDLLAARARRAFFEYMPIRESLHAPQRIYRAYEYGPLLDVIILDQRTHRGPNTANRQDRPGPETAFLGKAQLRWLKERLLRSRATWKVIASDMPIGLIVPDGKEAFENAANGDGPPLGREHEVADLLRFIKSNEIQNVVWLTADVHYAAAHFYDPAHARFTDFAPFWEFVAGPLNAGTFGPNPLDNTFGPQVKYQSVPEGMKPNRPPSEGKQYFGTVRVAAASRAMTVQLHDLEGRVLYTVELPPAQ